MVERYLRLTRHLGCRDLGGHEELRVDHTEATRIEAELAALGIDGAHFLLTRTARDVFAQHSLKL